MSAPEAKASRPAPRYTTARTESSLARPSVTFAISPHMARLTALRILGRLNTTVAMPPSRSTRISSLIRSPLLGKNDTHGKVSLAEAWENFNEWWRREDSNLRHGAYETPALPPELRRRLRARGRKLQAYGTRVKPESAAERPLCATSCP